MPAIDICGVTNKDDAKWAAIHGVEYVSVYMDPDSPRKVSLNRARSIRQLLPSYSEFALDFGSADNINLNYLEKISPSLVKFYLPEDSRQLEEVAELFSQEDYKIVVKTKDAARLAGELPFPVYIRQFELNESFEEDEIKLALEMAEGEKLMVYGDFEIDKVKKLCGIFKPGAWCIEEAILSSVRRIDYKEMKKYIREISLI